MSTEDYRHDPTPKDGPRRAKAELAAARLRTEAEPPELPKTGAGHAPTTCTHPQYQETADPSIVECTSCRTPFPAETVTPS